MCPPKFWCLEPAHLSFRAKIPAKFLINAVFVPWCTHTHTHTHTCMLQKYIVITQSYKKQVYDLWRAIAVECIKLPDDRKMTAWDCLAEDLKRNKQSGTRRRHLKIFYTVIAETDFLYSCIMHMKCTYHFCWWCYAWWRAKCGNTIYDAIPFVLAAIE